MNQPLNWVKSSKSSGNGNCVQVAEMPDGRIAVRDSKNPDGAQLHFTRAEWDAFIGGAHDYEFDF